MDITLNYTTLDPTGYLSCRVPPDILNTVRQEVNELIKTDFKTATPYNYSLASSIEHEYKLYKCVDILNKFFKQVIPEYWRFNNMPQYASNVYEICKSNDGPDIWVNLQKKYEYNPVHNHGGFLSFVLYINIPYSLDDELKQPHIVNSYSKLVPSFNFLYSSIKPNIDSTGNPVPIQNHSIKVDRTYEGVMLIFPSWLQHYVTPFYTSNDYRISVSGNIAQVNNG